VILLPGYEGRQLPSRRITADLPRRAVVVGSFDWMAKRMNLREFLDVADPMFAAAGVELQVIGDGDRPFLEQLRRELKTTEVTGRVDSVLPYLDKARMAIVAEKTGGGFKHKVLSYVFNRLPIAALDNSIAGVPLTPTESLLTYPDFQALAHGVLSAIDDLELLNRLQERAFAACSGRFDWRSRGEKLFAALAPA
jgi:glycosyltransferase involved in cell wall biosynthesis